MEEVGALTAGDEEQLRGIPLFARIPPRQFRDLLRTATIRTFSSGDLVLREHDPGDVFMVVLEGELEVFTTSDGGEIPLARVARGGWLGERALLAGKDGRRTASVRARTAVRCAEIERNAFDRHLASAPQNQETFAAAGAEQQYVRLVRSLAVFRDLELGPLAGHVRRRTFAAGSRVIRRGEPAEHVFLVLQGVALAVRSDNGAGVELARMGPGQCFGELGVVHHEPRAADVIADSDLELLEIDATQFLEWYERQPALRDWLGTLEQIYLLEGGRPLSVLRGTWEGRQVIRTVFGDPAGDCVVSTKVPEADTFAITRGQRPGFGSVERVAFEEPERGIERVLHLGDPPSGGAARPLVGVEVRGIDAGVGLLYRRVLDGAAVTSAELARFRRSGFLGNPARDRVGTLVCPCLGLGEDDVRRAARRCGNDPDAIRIAIGAGAVCGGCQPAIRELLRTSTPPALAPHPPGARSSVRPHPRARSFEPRFDAAAIRAIRGEPLMHVLAIASGLAPAGERFMIHCLSPRLTRLDDRDLASDLEVFLRQESNHIAAHEALNAILVEQVYPDVPWLARFYRWAFRLAYWLPGRLGPAVCAANEHAADCVFAAHLDHYYTHGRHDADPAVDRALSDSGVADLFEWHAAEELGHRHVPFDAFRATGGGYLSRVAGFAFVLLEITFSFAAFFALGRRTRTRPAVRHVRTLVRDLDLVRGFFVRLVQWLRPSFDPGAVEYAFYPRLVEDARRFPLEEA